MVHKGYRQMRIFQAELSPKSANTDATSTTRGSRSSFDVNASQQGPNLSMPGREFSSIDGRVRVFLLSLKIHCINTKQNFSVSHLRHLKLGQIIIRCQK